MNASLDRFRTFASTIRRPSSRFPLAPVVACISRFHASSSSFAQNIARGSVSPEKPTFHTLDPGLTGQCRLRLYVTCTDSMTTRSSTPYSECFLELYTISHQLSILSTRAETCSHMRGMRPEAGLDLVQLQLLLLTRHACWASLHSRMREAACSGSCSSSSRISQCHAGGRYRKWPTSD